MSHDHDNLFKAVFARPENAREHFERFLPKALTAQLLLDEAELMPGSFVDQALKSRHTDLLFRVPVSGSHQDALVYLLFEHQSTVDHLMPWRLLRYMVRIWESVLTDRGQSLDEGLPPIVPMVLYHGDGRWTGAVQFADIVTNVAGTGPFVPRFEFALTDLGVTPDEQAGGDSPGGLVRMLFKHARRPEFPLVWSQLGPGFEATAAQDESLRVVVQIVEYVRRTQNSVDHDAIRALIREHVGLRGEEMVMSIWKQAQDQAYAAGRDDGRVQGRAEGTAGTLLKLIHLKFGPPGDAVVEQVNTASDADLAIWTSAFSRPRP